VSPGRERPSLSTGARRFHRHPVMLRQTGPAGSIADRIRWWKRRCLRLFGVGLQTLFAVRRRSPDPADSPTAGLAPRAKSPTRSTSRPSVETVGGVRDPRPTMTRAQRGGGVTGPRPTAPHGATPRATYNSALFGVSRDFPLALSRRNSRPRKHLPTERALNRN
jgi:hypothetical protein